MGKTWNVFQNYSLVSKLNLPRATTWEVSVLRFPASIHAKLHWNIAINHEWNEKNARLIWLQGRWTTRKLPNRKLSTTILERSRHWILLGKSSKRYNKFEKKGSPKKFHWGSVPERFANTLETCKFEKPHHPKEITGEVSACKMLHFPANIQRLNSAT